MTRSRLLAAAALALATTVAACGVPADEAPRAIPEEQAPEDLAPDVEVGSGPSADATLFYTRTRPDERDVLVEVTRQVPTSGSPSPGPRNVLETLLRRIPEDAPLPDATLNRIPGNTTLAEDSPDLVNGILRVELGDPLDVQGEAAAYAYGQIVCTADALTGVDAVLFVQEGEAIAVVDGAGKSTSRPLRCADYESLLHESVALEGALSPAPGAG